MRNLLFTLKQRNWMDWVGVITLSVVTLQIFFSYPESDNRRWLALGILLVMLLSENFLCDVSRSPREHHLQFAFFSLLALGLIYLQANFNGVVVLFFVLSAQSLTLFPPRVGFAWVAVWSATVLIVLPMVWQSNLEALMVGFGVVCGMVFMGSAAYAQRRAEEASAESQRLLGELQTAHAQLKAYASKAEELAVAQERNRLAREMHDTLGHRLTVAATQLEGAQRLIRRDPDKASRMVETVRQQVVEGLTELRRTVATLRAPLEEDLSLPNALRRLSSQFQEATNIATDLDLTEPLPELSAEHRHTLYRTVQEALTNVQRHAQAHHVRIILTPILPANHADHPEHTEHTERNEIQVTIEDDGIGVPGNFNTGISGQNVVQSNQPKRFGLRGLQERAEQLHGSFLIASEPEGGTRVEMRLPL